MSPAPKEHTSFEEKRAAVMSVIKEYLPGQYNEILQSYLETFEGTTEEDLIEEIFEVGGYVGDYDEGAKVSIEDSFYLALLELLPSFKYDLKQVGQDVEVVKP